MRLLHLTPWGIYSFLSSGGIFLLEYLVRYKSGYTITVAKKSFCFLPRLWEGFFFCNEARDVVVILGGIWIIIFCTKNMTRRFTHHSNKGSNQKLGQYVPTARTRVLYCPGEPTSHILFPPDGSTREVVLMIVYVGARYSRLGYRRIEGQPRQGSKVHVNIDGWTFDFVPVPVHVLRQADRQTDRQTKPDLPKSRSSQSQRLFFMLKGKLDMSFPPCRKVS